MGATDTNGKQPTVTADMLTGDQIRGLFSDGYVDADTAWDAIYNDHTAVGRQARERCARTFNAIELVDDTLLAEAS